MTFHKTGDVVPIGKPLSPEDFKKANDEKSKPKKEEQENEENSSSKG
jgi:hypothetical protein